MTIDGSRFDLDLLVLAVPPEIGGRQREGHSIAEVWTNVLVQDLLDALYALPMHPPHVREVRIEQFVSLAPRTGVLICG